MKPERRFYRSTAHCGLCRSKFPSSVALDFDPWQNTFRAVMRLDSTDKTKIELTDVSTFNWEDKEVNVSLTGHAATQKVAIERFRDRETPIDNVAFCFHAWCYSTLIWRLSHCTKLNLYKLVRSMEKSPLWHHIITDNGQLDSEASLQALLANPPCLTLDLQPLFLSRLPPELRSNIWGYVSSRTAYSAFLLVAGEVSRLARYLRGSTDWILGFDEGSCLSANMVTVFGTEYIQHLFEESDDRKSESNLQIIGVVTGLKFITECNGICAVKLLGHEWESDWLGKIPNTGRLWYGIIQGTLPGLRCHYNNLNLIGISSLVSVCNQILWDRPDFPASPTDLDKAMFSFIDRETIYGCIMPRQRFFRYLPLRSNTLYTSGLTIYWQGNGMVGLEAQFKEASSYLSGRRGGVALHCPLNLGEQIAYVWLRIIPGPSYLFATPSFTIETTLGRLYTFGPYIMPRLVMEDAYKWVLLKNRGAVAGFYYEASPREIMRIGVHGDETSSIPNPLKPRCLFHGGSIPKIGNPNSGLFLSVASLDGLRRVDLCCVDNRCTGLLVHYVKGATVAMGQWHTSYGSKHCCIYNRNEQRISRICFRMSNPGGLAFITNICFLDDETEIVSDNEFRVFSFDQYIAWWFSEDQDEILQWTGGIQHVADQSLIHQ